MMAVVLVFLLVSIVLLIGWRSRRRHKIRLELAEWQDFVERWHRAS